MKSNTNGLRLVYCCKEHQRQDWREDHKTWCNVVKKARAKLHREEQKLRVVEPGCFGDGRPGESYIGIFWGVHETRPYMRARGALVDELLQLHTREAVQEALDHVMDMLRLCCNDNMGMRDLATALFLRLGRDHECYRFIKWWHLYGGNASSRRVRLRSTTDFLLECLG